MTSDAPDRPPPAPDWPELEALRALPADVALVEAGITDTRFAAALAERGTPVPPELLQLMAATDGLVLRNRVTSEVVFRLAAAAGFAGGERDGRPALVIGSWWVRPFGHSRDTVELWLEDGALTGAFESQRAGHPLERLRFGRRPLDVRDLLRFALARVEAQPATAEERERGVVDALYADRSWGWYLGDPTRRI